MGTSLSSFSISYEDLERKGTLMRMVIIQICCFSEILSRLQKSIMLKEENAQITQIPLSPYVCHDGIYSQSLYFWVIENLAFLRSQFKTSPFLPLDFTVRISGYYFISPLPKGIYGSDILMDTFTSSINFTHFPQSMCLLN